MVIVHITLMPIVPAAVYSTPVNDVSPPPFVVTPTLVTPTLMQLIELVTSLAIPPS